MAYHFESQDAVGNGIHGLFFLAIFMPMYLIPSIIAWNKKKRQAGAIFALNLLLGWTFLGWVIAFIWAFMRDSEPQTIVINNHQQPPIG